jgi:hypothetical protein
MEGGVRMHAFFVWINALISYLQDARRACLGFFSINYKKEVLSA